MRPEKMIMSDETVTFDTLDKEKTELITKELTDLINSDPKRYYAASNECGLTERAIAIKYDDNIGVYFNPVCTERSDLKFYREYDPITEKDYIIPRHTKITLVSVEDGKNKFYKLDEDSAVITEQAISVLDGVEDFVLGLEITEEFDKATDEERQEVLEAYKKSLADLMVDLDKQLTENEDTRDMWNAFKYSEAVNRGEIQLESDEPKRPNRKTRRWLKKQENRRKKHVN